MLSLQWKVLPVLKRFAPSENEKRERRVSPRSRSRNLIRSSEGNDSFKPNLSNLVDLSDTGLRFVARKKMKSGTLLSLTFNLPEQGVDIPAVAQVVWSRPIPGSYGNGFYVGVRFVELKQDHREAIRSFVRSRRRLPPS